ncbi:hypothetical protein [Ruminococcus sp.]
MALTKNPENRIIKLCICCTLLLAAPHEACRMALHGAAFEKKAERSDRHFFQTDKIWNGKHGGAAAGNPQWFRPVLYSLRPEPPQKNDGSYEQAARISPD